MTERLAEVTTRIQGMRQLGAVVNAMRGIAAARAQQARGQLKAVELYAGTIAAAIGRALALPGGGTLDPVRRSARPALVLFCAEQGFAGAFSERLLDHAGAELSTTAVFLVGSRGGRTMAERGLTPVWQTAMPAQSSGVPKLADHIVEALYKNISNGAIGGLDVMFSRWTPGRKIGIERLQLFPMDVAALAPAAAMAPPLVNLPAPALLSGLAANYLHAQLSSAALHAFAAENEARVEVMAGARQQIDEQMTELQAQQRQVRQEDITAEIIELAAGESATR